MLGINLVISLISDQITRSEIIDCECMYYSLFWLSLSGRSHSATDVMRNCGASVNL